MNLIANTIRIAAEQSKVLEAITTTAGHRGWWSQDCEVGAGAGEEAVFRFDAIEVVFRIDRVDGRGLEMTCVGERNQPDWLGTHLSIRAIEDGAGTYVDLVHDGYPGKGGCYDLCTGGWAHYLKSLRSYCETGRGTPYAGAPQPRVAQSAS